MRECGRLWALMACIGERVRVSECERVGKILRGFEGGGGNKLINTSNNVTKINGI